MLPMLLDYLQVTNDDLFGWSGTIVGCGVEDRRIGRHGLCHHTASVLRGSCFIFVTACSISTTPTQNWLYRCASKGETNLMTQPTEL